MKAVVLSLVALCVATLDVSACGRRPVRTFIANHRPGIIIPKPVYSAPPVAQSTTLYPTGGEIVAVGSPEAIARCAHSLTGRALAKAFARDLQEPLSA